MSAATPSRAPAASSVRRIVLTAVASAIGAFSTTGGLFVVVPSIQTGLLGGVIAGLVAPSGVVAAVVAAIAAAAAAMLGPATFWAAAPTTPERLTALAVAVPVAALTAWGTHWLAARRGDWPRIIVWVAVALVVANLWVTTLSTNNRPLAYRGKGQPNPAFASQIVGDNGAFTPGSADADTAWFYRIAARMRTGQGYYATYQQALDANANWVASSVLAFREPLAFWMWAALPNGQAIVVAFLVLTSLAVVALVPIAQATAKIPLAIPASAALASCFLRYSTGLPLFLLEIWAACFAVLALAAFALSRRSSRSRGWIVAAVLLSLVGALIRETLVLVLVAGMVSAFFEAEDRRFRLAAWGVGFLAFCIGYGAHALTVLPHVKAAPLAYGKQSLGYGVWFAWVGLRYGVELLGGRGVFAGVLALVGLAGAFTVRGRALRWFTTAAVGMTLVAFVIMRNDFFTEAGMVINYWGAGIVPFVYALIPAGMMLLVETPSFGPNASTGGGSKSFGAGKRTGKPGAKGRLPGRREAANRK